MAQEEYWTTREGKTIPVGDMTEQHAKNALRMMIRNQKKIMDIVSKAEARVDEAISWKKEMPKLQGDASTLIQDTWPEDEIQAEEWLSEEELDWHHAQFKPM